MYFTYHFQLWQYITLNFISDSTTCKHLFFGNRHCFSSDYWLVYALTFGTDILIYFISYRLYLTICSELFLQKTAFFPCSGCQWFFITAILRLSTTSLDHLNPSLSLSWECAFSLSNFKLFLDFLDSSCMGWDAAGLISMNVFLSTAPNNRGKGVMRYLAIPHFRGEYILAQKGQLERFNGFSYLFYWYEHR